MSKCIGIDCCQQKIVPIREKLTMKTNRHPNIDGTSWGWIDGCDRNICWSNNKSFNSKAASELVNKWNDGQFTPAPGKE